MSRFDGTKAWLASVREMLEDSHTCQARRVAERACVLLADAVKLLEDQDKVVADLKKKILTASLEKLTDKAAASAMTTDERFPRIWRDGEEFPSEDGVVTVQDNDGDIYTRAENGNYYRKGMSPGASGLTMEWIVEEYGPIVEVGDGILKIRWFDNEVGEDFTFSGKVLSIVDAAGDIWGVVSGDGVLWETKVRDSDEIKEDGHWTLHKIASETGSVMIRQSTVAIPLLKFEKGEDSEPHETIKYVYDGDLRLYFHRTDDGKWYAPGVREEKMKILGFSGESVDWDELLGRNGELEEHRR